MLAEMFRPPVPARILSPFVQLERSYSLPLTACAGQVDDDSMGVFSKGDLPAPLTAIERAELAKCEAAVTDGVRAFAIAGKALARIREKQLYRETHDTFETYVSAKWKMSRQHALRLIDAAEVVRNLAPIGSQAAPLSEFQARQLAPLTPDAQREAWGEVVADAPLDSAGKPVVSTEAIESAVAKRRPKKGRRKAQPRPTRIRVPGAIVIVTPNKKFTGTPADALRASLEKLESVPVAKAA